MAHYEKFLKPILSAEQFEKAETFMKEAAYDRDGENRHGYSNANKSFFKLTGGCPPGDDFGPHCEKNGKEFYGDPKKGFPTKYACQSLRQSMLRDPTRFAQYLLDNITWGGSGLSHPKFNGRRVGRAFLPKGALRNRDDVLDMLDRVFIHKTMTDGQFREAMVHSHNAWVANN